jgi:hypothetical protein
MTGAALLLKEIRKRELWPQLVARLKFNDCHDPHSGEFCSGGGGEQSAAKTGYEALYDHQNHAHGKINEDLRAGKTSPEHEAYVAAIDQAIADVPARAATVFRGDGAGFGVALAEANPLPDNFKVNLEQLTFPSQARTINEQLTAHFRGMVVEDKAYLSTSTSQAIALDKFVPGNYDITKWTGSGLVEISGKLQALDIDKVTKMGAKEKERLLPRGLKLRVDSVSVAPHPDGHRVYLHWKVSVVA